jgi:hypothetical protein
MVVEGVKGLPSSAAHADEPRSPEQSKLVRYGRFAESDERGKVADAALAMRQCIYNPHAGRIAEEFEDIGDGFQGPATQQALADVR